jgi:hypothetical protein
MYEGAYHPIIHLGSSSCPSSPKHLPRPRPKIINIGTLFRDAEAVAAIAYPTAKPKPMIHLSASQRHDPECAPLAGEALQSLAAQFLIRRDEEELERRTAEMISTCAFFAGAAQHPGRKQKIDFYSICTT